MRLSTCMRESVKVERFVESLCRDAADAQSIHRHQEGEVVDFMSSDAATPDLLIIRSLVLFDLMTIQAIV